MTEQPNLSFKTQTTEAVLGGYRDRIVYWLSLMVIAISTIAALENFAQGHIALALVVVVLLLAAVLYFVPLHLGRRPPFAFAYFLIPIALAVAGSIAWRGVDGALWCFPVVLVAYFLLPRRGRALTYSLALVIYAAPALYITEDLNIAARFLAAMFLTIFFVEVITRVINTLQLELFDMALTDPLTGAFNRRYMEMVLRDAIVRSGISGAGSSLMFIDLDHFKGVNDTFGHEAGDRVLKNTVAVAKRCAGKSDRVFRMGGEEFLLFMPDSDLEAAAAKAEEVRAAIAAEKMLEGRVITASFGVATNHPDMTLETWLKHADLALYEAKSNGRNKVVCARPGAQPSLFPETAAETDARNRRALRSQRTAMATDRSSPENLP